MKTLIENATLITPTERIPQGKLLIEGDTIAACGRTVPDTAPDRLIDAGGMFVAPGFIDLHAQGAGGFDLWDADDDNFITAISELAAGGTTSCQASVAPTRRVCEIMRPRTGRSDCGTTILGLYFEMPFISKAKRGAIPVECLETPSPAAARQIIDFSRDILSMIVIAPELPGALELIETFSKLQGPAGNVVVSIGHTNADFDQAMAGVNSGISHATHLFNAMPTPHHRSPGPVGAVLAQPEVSAEIICDGFHLHPAVVNIAVACKGVGKTCLITDVVSGKMHDVSVADGAPRLPDGTLAGSILTMDRAVANVQRFAGAGLEQAVEMATLSPAKVIGLDDKKGSLAPGKDADIVIFDADVKVDTTIIGGEIWERPG